MSDSNKRHDSHRNALSLAESLSQASKVSRKLNCNDLFLHKQDRCSLDSNSKNSDD
jgi:hypothetical protein